MSTVTPLVTSGQITASELRKMPAAERDAIMLAASKIAEADYCQDSDLTAFEAFGKEDIYGQSANAATQTG